MSNDQIDGLAETSMILSKAIGALQCVRDKMNAMLDSEGAGPDPCECGDPTCPDDPKWNTGDKPAAPPEGAPLPPPTSTDFDAPETVGDPGHEFRPVVVEHAPGGKVTWICPNCGQAVAVYPAGVIPRPNRHDRSRVNCDHCGGRFDWPE